MGLSELIHGGFTRRQAQRIIDSAPVGGGGGGAGSGALVTDSMSYNAFPVLPANNTGNHYINGLTQNSNPSPQFSDDGEYVNVTASGLYTVTLTAIADGGVPVGAEIYVRAAVSNIAAGNSGVMLLPTAVVTTSSAYGPALSSSMTYFITPADGIHLQAWSAGLTATQALTLQMDMSLVRAV